MAERDIAPQQDFEAWLRQRRLVPEKRIPFVLAWVRRFQRLRQSPSQHTPLDSEQLLVEMEQLLRLRHYAPCTMQTYLSWARRFLQYLKQSGGTLGAAGGRAYLSHLATARKRGIRYAESSIQRPAVPLPPCAPRRCGRHGWYREGTPRAKTARWLFCR